MDFHDLIPTPNEWLKSAMRNFSISRAGLARLIGRTREEVQRWANGREQVPRYHLAEIASQLCSPEEVDLVLRLKDCEDLSDRLRRQLHDLSRRARCDADSLESKVFDVVLKNVSETPASASRREYISLYLRTIIDAGFVFRLWNEGAASGDFDSILTSDNIHRHLRYPCHHFFGLALDVGESLLGTDKTVGLLAEYRSMVLASLRKSAVAKPVDVQLVRSHATHLLARHGTIEDQTIVQDLINGAKSSGDPLSKRLGYVGLMLNSDKKDNQEAIHHYAWLLKHDESLATIDLFFDAIHYGDACLQQKKFMPTSVSNFNNVISNLLRHLEHFDRYALELDGLRLFKLMNMLGPSSIFSQPEIWRRLEGIMAKLPPPPRGTFLWSIQEQMAKHN